MWNINKKIKRIVKFINKINRFITWEIQTFPLKDEFGYCGKNSCIEYPCNIGYSQNVFIEENVYLRYGINIINSETEKVIIKKYSVIAPNCTIVTNNHRSTVSIPQFLLGASHVNDKSANVIINEDVWIGTGAIILAGVNIGRGSIVSSGAIVTHDVEPYSLVVGSPAKKIKRIFSISQIIEHEKALYKEDERIAIKDLQRMFELDEKEYDIYGTTEGLSIDAIQKINEIKNKANYINPF